MCVYVLAIPQALCGRIFLNICSIQFSLSLCLYWKERLLAMGEKTSKYENQAYQKCQLEISSTLITLLTDYLQRDHERDP